MNKQERVRTRLKITRKCLEKTRKRKWNKILDKFVCVVHSACKGDDKND